MTSPTLAPRWSADEDWTSFLMLIVPVAHLPIPVYEVERAVKKQIESDAALFDLFAVARAPGPEDFQEQAEWSRALLASLLEGAMPQGHLLAPRAVLTIVVVGQNNEEIEELAAGLQEWESLERLAVRFFGCRVVADPRHGGVAAGTLRAVADIATKIMTVYEQYPEVAIQESTFLAEIAELVEQGLVAPMKAVAPSPAPESFATSALQAPDPPKRATRSAPPLYATVTTPGPHPGPSQTRPSPGSSRPSAPPPREAQPPVFHRGEEMVMVDGRSALRRLRGSAPTDAESVEWLSEITKAVSLAYLVFVPDEESSRRKVSREYRRIALDLDQLLGTVVGDARSGLPMRVAVEVLTAVSPLHKHGILHPAGELVDNDLPKARSEFYNHSRTVDALLSAAQRTARAFHARRTQVMSLHYIFLSGMPLSEARTDGADWDRLLHFARATWVEVSSAKSHDSGLPSGFFNEVPVISPSPFGFHVVSDNCDVPALVRAESSSLYRYDPLSAVPSTRISSSNGGPPSRGKADDSGEKEGESRRRWMKISTDWLKGTSRRGLR